jgi:hypothetical protein
MVARGGFEDGGYGAGSAVDISTPIGQAVVSGFRVSGGDVQVEKKVVATTKQLEYHVEGLGSSPRHNPAGARRSPRL